MLPQTPNRKAKQVKAKPGAKTRRKKGQLAPSLCVVILY